MMDRKPWENRDSHREGFGGRREWNSDRSDRRFGEDRPRFNREDRFGNDRPRFNREDRFGEDRPRFNRENRFEGGDRRFGGDRPRVNRDDRPRFGGDRPRFNRDDRYSSKTGPRARAFGEGRFQDREDYSKRQIVKIDSEVAAFFPTAKDVNDALRLVIELTRKVKERTAEAAEEKLAADAETAEDVEDTAEDDYEEDETEEVEASEAEADAPAAKADKAE